MRKIYSITKNESGYSLLLVFFTLILVSVLSISLLNITKNSLTLSKHEREDQSIFYIAEAGLNVEKQNINRVVYEAYNYTKELHKSTPEEDRNTIDFTKVYVDKIKTDLNSKYPSTFRSFETQFGKQPEAKIEVNIEEKLDNKNNNPLKINITSTGYFDDVVTNNRVVTQSINVDLNLKFLTNIDEDSDGESETVPDLPKLAVQTTGDIIIRGSKIIGSIATNSGSLILDGSPTISGSIGVKENQLIAPDWMIDQFKDKVVDMNVPEIPLPAFPNDTITALSTLPYPPDLEVTNNGNTTKIISGGKFLGNSWIADHYTLNLNQDIKFSEFTIGGNNTINLNIGNNTVNLLVDKLNVSGHINIIGSGKLNIYVKNSLHIHGSINKDGDPNQVNIYYAGNSDLSFAGGTSISGSLYAQNANLNFTGGLNFKGNIITGGSKVHISGGTNTGGQYIIAPNAHISLSGGAHIKGVVIGKSFEGSDGSTVEYAESVVPPPFKPNPTPDYSDPEDLISEEDLVEI